MDWASGFFTDLEGQGGNTKHLKALSNSLKQCEVMHSSE